MGLRGLCWGQRTFESQWKVNKVGSQMNTFKDEHSKIKLRTGLQKPDFRYPEILFFLLRGKVPF